MDRVWSDPGRIVAGLRSLPLVGAGFIGILGGALLGGLGICPVVKAIWTPSWVLFSGGLCLLFLAGFHVWLDKPQTAPAHPTPVRRRLVYPLLIVGMNSIAAYALSHLFPAFAYNSIRRVTGREIFQICGEAYEPLLYGAVILVGYWIALFALYRGKIFLRV
jgi:predicted acyltransferase